MDTFSIFAVYAALEALSMASINTEDGSIDNDRFGAIIGSGIGGLPVIQEQGARLATRGPKRIAHFLYRFLSPIWRQEMLPCVLKQMVLAVLK